MKLLLSIMVVSFLTEEVVGDSAYLLSVKDSKTLVYYIRKAPFPICHSISISPYFIYVSDRGEFIRSNLHTRQDAGNRFSNVWKRGRLERGWAYLGYLITRYEWLRADVTFICYNRRRRELERASKTLVRKPKGLRGILIFPKNGRVAVAVVVDNKQWQRIDVRCWSDSFMDRDKKQFNKTIACFQKGAKKGKNGLFLVDCGATLLYGISDYKCRATAIAQGLTSQAAEEVYYYPEFKAKVAKPLAPILTGIKYNTETNKVTYEHVYQYDSLANNIDVKVVPDSRTSDAPIDADYKGNRNAANPFDSDSSLYSQVGISYYQSGGDNAYPSQLASNRNLEDFTLTSGNGPKYWTVHFNSEIPVSFIRVYSRSDYTVVTARTSSALSLLYILTIQSNQFKLPSKDNGWRRHHYQFSPYGSRPITYQIIPSVLATQFALYTTNPSDALSLSEVEIHGNVKETVQLSIPWRKGADYIISVQSKVRPNHYTRRSDDLSGPWTYSDVSYLTFHANEQNGLPSDEVCNSYKYNELKEYYNCTVTTTLNANTIGFCRRRSLTLLKDLVECLNPNDALPTSKFDFPTPYEGQTVTSDIYSTDLSGVFGPPEVESLEVGSYGEIVAVKSSLVIFLTALKVLM